MKICTTYSTNREDLELAQVVVLAKGETLDEMVPEITDQISAEFAMAQAIGKEVKVTDGDGNEIAPNVFSVCEALTNGAKCIILTHTLPYGDTYENVFTINDLGE
jgi:hypothetical protein